MNNSRNYSARPMVAIPRHPTIKDAHAFMEFLAEERPQLYEALDAVERAYRTLGVDFGSDSRDPDESDGT